MKKSITLFVVALVSLGAHSQPQQNSSIIEVKSYLDKQSSGWAYKKSDYAFEAAWLGCIVKWNAIESKDHVKESSKEQAKERSEDKLAPGQKRSLLARVDYPCKKGFKDLMPAHRAILTKVFERWPVKAFDTLSWYSFANHDSLDWSWNIPIALAAYHSADYQDYRLHYPQSKITNVNALFVRLAKHSNAYRELRELFQVFAADVELISVEKVFAQKAQELPFYPELEAKGVKGNPRLIYDVGFSYFQIK